MSNEVSKPIGQKSFTNYRALVLSYELREAMLGILNPGVYSGFDTLHVYADSLGLTHEQSGIIKTVYLTSEQGGGVGKSQPTGVFVTKFGTIVHDDTEVKFPKPVDDGIYLVYAKYLRPTAGDEYTVMVPVTYLTMMVTDQKGETDINKLGETDTPITMFKKQGDNFTLLSHEQVVMSTPNPMDMGNMTQLDLLTSMGTLGVGRFKFLGRTLQSISQFMSDQIDWNHWQEDWDRTLLRRVGWPSYPDGSNQDDQNYGVKFISSIWTIWNDLVALDKECQRLWAKLGYPDEQPENEKVLFIANTVWQNMVALEAYSDKLSDEIWQRLGLTKGEPSEIHSILDKADTVWNNILKLLDKLDKLDNHVRTDSFEAGGIQANLDHIWATLGYDNQVDRGTYKTILQSKSVWENMKEIFNYIESDVEKNNDFVITQLVVNGKETGSRVELGLPSHNKKTFLWEISENTALSSGDVREFTLNLARPWTDDKFDQRVSLLVWRPTKPGLKLFITGGITQAKMNDKVEFYLSNGGMALLYKLTKNQTKWYIQILNPGSSGGGGGGGDYIYEGQGLMPGYEEITTGSNWTGPTTYVVPNQGCIRCSTEVGVSDIRYDAFVQKASSTSAIYWGAKSTYYIALARPKEEQLGVEKIIRLSGGLWDVGPDAYSAAALPDPGSDSRSVYYYTNHLKRGICINFSLPLQTVMPPIQWKIYNFQGGYRGVITHWQDGSYLKWPGDWVRLRAEVDPNDGTFKWRIIENGYGQNISKTIYQCRWGEGANNNYDRDKRIDFYDTNVRGDLFQAAENDQYWLQNSFVKQAPFNAVVQIHGRNKVYIRVPMNIRKGNDKRLMFDPALPFPDVDQVGQMRQANSYNATAGVYWSWYNNPELDWYGQLQMSTWNLNEQCSPDFGWDFCLGGPVKAMANYVMHNIEFEE